MAKTRPAPPASDALKSEWVAYAMTVDPQLASFDAWALTVDELRAEYGATGLDDLAVVELSGPLPRGVGVPVVPGPVDDDSDFTAPYDPRKHTVPEVLEHLAYADAAEVARVLEVEQTGRARAGIMRHAEHDAGDDPDERTD